MWGSTIGLYYPHNSTNLFRSEKREQIDFPALSRINIASYSQEIKLHLFGLKLCTLRVVGFYTKDMNIEKSQLWSISVCRPFYQWNAEKYDKRTM